MTTAKKLNQLIGLQRAKNVVSSLMLPENGVQSVLLYGPTGSGKTALGTCLAQAWLCTQPSVQGACGACPSCLAYGRGTHADFLSIEPQPPSYLIRLAAISPASGDEATLSIQEFFRTAPLMGRRKVVVIHDADRMNAGAANAFLKTLEEPPPWARIALTSGSPGAILPTILSRCLAAACELPTAQELHSRFPLADELELAFAEGAPGRLAQGDDLTGARRQLYDFAARVGQAQLPEALALSEGLRSLAELYDKKLGTGVRASTGAVLADLAIAFQRHGLSPFIFDTIEAHRRILANGSAALVLDALFVKLLSQQT